MKRAPEALELGWRPGPVATVATCAGVLLATAVAIAFAGLAAGAGVLGVAGVVVLLQWQDARIDGPLLQMRGGRSLGRGAIVHARAIDRIEYRRHALPPRLAVQRSGWSLSLVAYGPSAGDEAFRRVAVWLIVHGRRQARIDARLLDALAGMPDHARLGSKKDASPA